MRDNSTIAAISTPYGKGGIAVIRISGNEAFCVADRFFFAASGKKAADIKPNTAVFGKIFCDGEQIDEGIAVFFKAPHSYTGEDTVEISCHGGILLSQKVLESALNSGAVPAGRGEFTKRAFLSGKLGLSQAESVIELIDAESEEKIKLASAGTRGILSGAVNEIYEELKALVASTYVYIDFPDEDLTDVSVEELRERLCAIKEKAEALKKTYKSGKAISCGVDTVIAGKPNTGKSSVLNALLGEERAIVTDIAGTTRDTIEEKANIGKVMLNLSDTAGIRGATDDRIERIGIERSMKKLSEAELIIAVFDGSSPLSKEDEEFISTLKSEKKTVICLLNKCDIGTYGDTEKRLSSEFEIIIKCSAKNGDGICELKNAAEKLFVDGDIDYGHTAIVANARQNSALTSGISHICGAIDALKAGMTQDIACLDLEAAMADLAEIDGREVTEELVDNIFHRFCVGK